MQLSAEEVARMLADGDRLRVAAALVLGATSVEEVVRATDIAVRRVGTALARLEAAGLIERDAHVYRFAEEVVRLAARSEADEDAPAEHPLVEAPVLRAFVAGSTLVALPTNRRKLRQILDLLAQDFEVGLRYSEQEVNEVLGRWHPDVAALRRHLVDEGFLDREGGGGSYWRSGGTTLV